MNFETMTIEELEARKAAIGVDVEADGADLNALEAEVRAINEELEARRAAAEKKAEVRKAIAEGKGETTKVIDMEEKTMDVMEIRNSAEYVNAYANYIKTNSDAECRALLSTNVSGGVVPVPTMVYDVVKTAWEREGIMALVRKAYVKGNLKVGFERSATGAVVHTEGAEAPDEETLVLGVVELVPQSIKKWISISDEVMDMSGEGFLQYIYNEVAYQIAKKAADTLIAKIEAAPTTSTASAPAITKVTASTIAMGTIAAGLAAVSDEASNPVIMMNKASYAAFKAVQYANGYGADPFEGLPVIFNNTIKAYSAASTGDTYAIVGDLGHGALANFPNGDEITFKFDDLSLAEADLVKIVGREFVAIGVVAPNAFAKIVK